MTAIATEASWKSAAEYHRDTSHLSHSALEVFRRSPMLYFRRYIEKTLVQEPATDAMTLGSALHCWLLERDQFENLFILKPENIDRRTKTGKTVWGGFLEAAAGRTVIERETFKLVQRLADAVASNEIASELLSAPGENEHTITWNYFRNGCGQDMPCKARLDRWLEPAGIIVDIKTAADPSPEAFASAAHKFGYHRQADWYMQGIEKIHGPGSCNEFLFVAIGTSEPHEVAVYELDADSLELGRRQNQADMDSYIIARDTQCWESPWHGQINRLSLPRYAFKREDF